MRPRTEARKVSGEKTCLPTFSISDVARVLAYKYFVYNVKWREIGFRSERFRPSFKAVCVETRDRGRYMLYAGKR